MGRDRRRQPPSTSGSDFNPLSPHGERRGARLKIFSRPIDFNPLSPHGERPPPMSAPALRPGISIHSPRMGRDWYTASIPQAWPISIHSPRMGRDACNVGKGNFRPGISIHSPRMGRDNEMRQAVLHGEFQSTLPAWGETQPGDRRGAAAPISIHSPRMGRDGNRPERHLGAGTKFQSTLPAWGETIFGVTAGSFNTFQSTLPAWGETSTHIPSRQSPQYFNPLSPHGERHGHHRDHLLRGDISIHSPRMGRDAILRA